MTTITDPAVLVQIAALNSQIIALNNSINSGVTRASYNGQSVEYRSMDEMKQAYNRAQVQLATLLNPTYRKPTAGVAHYHNPFGYHTRRPFR